MDFSKNPKKFRLHIINEENVEQFDLIKYLCAVLTKGNDTKIENQARIKMLGQLSIKWKQFLQEMTSA